MSRTDIKGESEESTRTHFLSFDSSVTSCLTLLLPCLPGHMDYSLELILLCILGMELRPRGLHKWLYTMSILPATRDEPLSHECMWNSRLQPITEGKSESLRQLVTPESRAERMYHTACPVSYSTNDELAVCTCLTLNPNKQWLLFNVLFWDTLFIYWNNRFDKQDSWTILVIRQMSVEHFQYAHHGFKHWRILEWSKYIKWDEYNN